MREGKITQIIGAVLDVQFDKETLPSLYNAIEIPLKDGGKAFFQLLKSKKTKIKKWPEF